VKVCVTVEHRFERTPDGAVWTGSNHSYEESSRYLDVFDGVRIIARVRDVSRPPQGGLRADGEGVTFVALPYYVGFQQFCLRWNAVRKAAPGAVGESDAVILKAPSVISCLIEPALRKRGRPFAVQVIADPQGIFSKGSLSHPLRPLVRSLLTHRTAAQCRHACAVAYVTQSVLQARYPASPAVRQTAISDVNLPASAFVDSPRDYPLAPSPVHLVSVGALEQPYKGIDVLLRALRLCADRGLDFRLSVIGDGRLRPELASFAAQLGIGSLVEFRGALPAGAKVFAALDESDLFVMPSRYEGLPRAMLEAMARGLPCIGSAVGGIPELLDGGDIVEAGNSESLAARILEVCNSPERMRRMSRRNLNLAAQFQEHILNARWREFYTRLRETTAQFSKDSDGGTRLAGYFTPRSRPSR